MRAVSEARRRLLRAGLAGAAALVLPARAAEPELRVITLRHRLPEELAPALRPLLGPGESVSSFNGKLIVRASPTTLAQIERALAELDSARRNLRITVRHASEREAQELSASVSGTLRSDNARVTVTGTGDRPPGGGSIRHEDPNGNVTLQGERRITTARENLTQTLTVLDGGHAFLRIGESVPVVQPFLALAGRRLTAVAGIDYYDVVTGFDVAPRLRGDTVELAIAPRLSFRSNQGMQTVDFRELSTTVSVKLGEWLDLGGAVESANEINRHILAATRRHDSGDQTRFLVRVD
jgi:type II secretory pathway component GspD/PulD (secretin)